MQVAERIWQQCLERLEDELSAQQFNTWIRPLHAVTEGRTLRLLAPNHFVLDWVSERLLDQIQGALAQLSGDMPPEIRLEVGARPTQTAPAAPAPTPAPAAQVTRTAPPASAASVQRDGSTRKTTLNPTHTFDSFVEGKSNQLARAASMQVAENTGKAYNPLFIYGGVGLGKTHLMHSVGNLMLKHNPNANVVYLHSERFVADMVKALQHNAINEFKRHYRSVDALLIDDIQFFAGKERSQEEFFHTFNALVDQGRQIVISADKSPADLEDIGDRLRSRLASGLVADIHPTTYELRLSILQSKADQMGQQVPEKVLEFLAHKIATNVRELEGALTRLVAHAQLVGRDLSLETAQDVLRDVLRAHDRRVTIEEIQKKVAEHFQIRVSDMHSARRSRSVARPRQVAMYLSKQLTSRSLPEIGRKFGGRDHTTVMHAVKKIEELMGEDPAFGEDVELLRRMLES